MKKIVYIFSVIILQINSCQSDKVVEQANNVKELKLSDQQIKFNQFTYSNLEEKQFSPIVTAFGKVEVPPQNKVIINTKYGGFIRKINVLDGQKVKKGEVLLEIEDPNLLQMQQEYIENKSTLEYLKLEMERQEMISKQDAGSIKNFQLAKSNYLNSKAKNIGLKSKLELAGIKVDKLNEDYIQKVVNIVSPFDGIVTKINIETGEFVNADNHLLEVIDTKHIHAEIFVYEKDIDLLRVSQKVKLIFNNQNKSFDAKIYLIGHDINSDKTIKVHAHFDKEPNDVVPGSLFKAKIQSEGKKYFSLPKHAVVNHQDLNYIFMKVENKNNFQYFKAIKVKILNENETDIAVDFENIERINNKKFVVNGSYELYSIMFANDDE